VGARLEPKSGLQAYFEPQIASLKDSSYLSGGPTKVTPTAGLICSIPAAKTGLARQLDLLLEFIKDQAENPRF